MRKILVTVLSILMLASLGPKFSTGTGAQKSINPHREPQPRKYRSRALSNGGRVISTGTAESIQAGVDMLNRGGSAADAVLASALARITLDMGNIVSFAGIYMMVYYEASTGKVYSLNAPFKTVLEEDSPLTIPSSGIPNARAVLVPGFMAGVQAAHDHFGRLTFPEIFAPAIAIAENGFTLSTGRINYIREHWDVLGVLPETRNIFLKRRYGLFRDYKAGDLFKQPELAHTLRQVATHGADYMYTGDWARHLVEIVRREGGKLSLRDLAEYEVVWAEPNHTTHMGYDIHALGSPSLGAMMVVLSLNLMEQANLVSYDHYTRSADALYRMIYCSRIPEFLYMAYAPEILETQIPEGDFSYAALANKENARLIWEKVESGEWPAIENLVRTHGRIIAAGGHSEAIITVDAEGNVAAVCHTINSDNWGNSGIFVDGVSIPGAGYFQQRQIEKIGPGVHLPDTTNPVLVLRNGMPVVASSCIGSDLHSATVQNLYNMLHFDMDMSRSRDQGKFQSIDWYTLNQKIRRGAIATSITDAVQAMGMGLTFVNQYASEWWIGLNLTHPYMLQPYPDLEEQK